MAVRMGSRFEKKLSCLHEGNTEWCVHTSKLGLDEAGQRRLGAEAVESLIVLF